MQKHLHNIKCVHCPYVFETFLLTDEASVANHATKSRYDVSLKLLIKKLAFYVCHRET